MRKVKEYYAIQSLINIKLDIKTNGSPLFGYADSGKGKSFYLNSCKNIRHISVLELSPKLGPRGRHYHKTKLEMIYVISGKAVLKLWLPIPQFNIEEEIIKKNDFIIIRPGVVHEFKAIEPTMLLETSPNSFNLADNFYPEPMK